MTERGGKATYKGINAQSWAAMSLFLQHLKQPAFSRIVLEEDELKDFTLYFNDGHKVICESKDRKQSFSYKNLKDLLNSILKKTILGEKDEVLVICTNLNDELKSYVNWMKYIDDSNHEIWQLFKKKGFSDKAIWELKKVRFWKVAPEKHHLAVYALFSEILNFWLPESELECKADSILVKKIYEGSAKGDTFTRDQLFQMIDEIRSNAKKYSGYFKDEKEKAETRLKKLLKAIKNNQNPVWSEYPLSALSTEPSLMWFVLEEFKKKAKLDLTKWKEIWEQQKVYRYSFQVFHVFRNNLHSAKNREYVLYIIGNNISEFRGYFSGDVFELDVIKTLQDILKSNDKKLHNRIFDVIKKLLKANSSDYFYQRGNQHVDYRKEQVCSLLSTLYKKSDASLQNNIIAFTFDTFNLVEDDGQFSFYTPRNIFDLVKENVLKRKKSKTTIKKLIIDFVAQYDKHYEPIKKKTLKRKFYQGWELMGGGISSSNGHCSVGDRHFIESILQPLILQYYKNNKQEAWNFIIKECATKEKTVSRGSPDFLNRSIIPVILEEYFRGSEKNSKTAFDILTEFVTSKRGIPHKADLIFQELRRWPLEYEKKKCELVKKAIEKWKLPINPFTDELVLGFIQSQDTEIQSWAVETIKSWFENPAYYSRDSLARKEVAHTLQDLIGHEKTSDLGITLLKSFISTDYFKEKYDHFSVYDLGRVLNGLLKANFDKGIVILNEIKSQTNLTWNQQTLLTHSFLNSHNQESDTKEFLNKLYDQFVDTWLAEMGNSNKKIVKKLTEPYPRQRIVEFAEKLAREKEIEKALRIVECFIDDPDPCLPADEKDEESKKYNEHKKILEGHGSPTITSVRGYCAWTIQHCLVMEGRTTAILDKIIDFTKKLVSRSEKNYYIKYMACFPLARLAQLRLAHTGDNETLFFEVYGGRKEALKEAKKIEEIAFDLLEQITEYPKAAQNELSKSILSVFNYIRGLNTADAKKLIDLLLKFSPEAIGEAAALFIYFAYYRKDAFLKWKWQEKGLYDDLAMFDGKYFVEKLNKLLDREEEVIRSKFAWHLFLLTDNKHEKNETQYSQDFKLAYDGLLKMMQHYDKNTFGTIFRFIHENMKHRFGDCYKLFLKWLDFIPAEKGLNDLGYQQYDDLLEEIKKYGGDDEFLKSLGLLLAKPGVWHLDSALGYLKSFPKNNKTVNKLFDQLIGKNSRHFTDKQEWLNKK